MKKLSGGCTLDCFDCCKFNVYVENGQVVKIEGDKEHPYTKGMICSKGIAHIDRTNHPNRQYQPLLKVEGKWKEISFEEAITLMADRLSFYKRSAGTNSVLYYEQYGSGSVLKSMGDLFFNFYGGCAKQKGGPCWSAGTAAQKQNFGDVRSHSLEDMMNSKTILVWGKNPAHTTIHTMQMIKKAQKNGSYVIVIDPVKTATAKQADCYVAVKPDGDGALALAMAKRILEQGKQDQAYLDEYVNGVKEYVEYVKALDMESLCKKAGVSLETVDFIVEKYTRRYSTILLGYGLQKYANGGNTIHLIDALAAITGQIGESGGGVNYANRVFSSVLDSDPYHSENYAKNQEFYVSRMSSYINENTIKMAVVVKSNLFNQLPALGELEQAFKNIEFKVCFDQFLTDTAEHCDLFIPTTTVLESEDLLYSSMTNPYLTYIEQAVQPKDPRMDEYVFFQELARCMNLEHYPMVSKREYLSKVIEPLRQYNDKISLDYLKDHYFTIHKSVPWADKCFKTKSGKFELLFHTGALEEKKSAQAKYPFRMLTNHSRESLFSQHFMDKEEKSKAYINRKMAQKLSFEQGQIIKITSPYGEIEVQLQIDEAIGDYVVMMYVGWWKKHGNPNWILPSGISDIGGQVTYNDNFVRLSAR